MFYSEDFRLTKNGGMGIIWLAATLGPKSKRGPSKRQILACDVSETCQKIIDPVEPLALRTSAGLLVGVVRVYDNKVEIFHKDVEQLETMVRKASLDFNVGTVNVDLAGGGTARHDQITISRLADDSGQGLNIGLDIHDWQSFLNDFSGGVSSGLGRSRRENTAEGDSENEESYEDRRRASSPRARQRHIADAKDITLPAASRAHGGSMGWLRSPLGLNDRMNIDERAGSAALGLDGDIDLGLDIGMDMPVREGSGSLGGSFGNYRGGGFSSSVGGHGVGLDVQMGDAFEEPLDLGLDVGMDLDQPTAKEARNGREPSLTASEQARQDFQVGQDALNRTQNQGRKRDIQALLREESQQPSEHGFSQGEQRDQGDDVPPSGVAVDEGVAGLGGQAKDKKRRKLRTTDQKIELSDAELKGFRESYGFRMDKLRRDQRTREEQRQRLALVKTGVIEMPVLLPFKAEIMVAFWNDLTHKNFGGRDQEAQPHGFADNLEMDHQGDDLAVGLEGDVIDRDGDIDMEQGRGERAGYRLGSDMRAGTQDFNEIEFGRRATQGSQKSTIFPWDKLGAAGTSDFGDGGFGVGFGSSIGGTGARLSLDTPQDARIQLNRRARSNSLLPSNQGSLARAGSAAPLDLDLPIDNEDYGLRADDMLAGLGGNEVAGGKAAWLESIDSLDDNTQRFLNYIKTVATHQDVFEADQELLFDDIAPVTSSGKNVAANAFYHCLSLATKDIIKLTQDEAYDTIRLEFKLKL